MALALCMTLSASSAHFRDTWHEAIGVQYRRAPQWLLSAGFAHDSAPGADLLAFDFALLRYNPTP
jgi:long-subunit fatty acid transport protein